MTVWIFHIDLVGSLIAAEYDRSRDIGIISGKMDT